jgi:RNA:NAD 2'-phosphotransferase (TPT1/KptA family)
MILYHATSLESIPSIRASGIKMSENEDNGLAVCTMDSLDKARDVAAYFGPKGVVLEIEVPDEAVEFHPDYGHGREFDTIWVRQEVPPSAITRIWKAPGSLPAELARPTNQQLRAWKRENQLKDPEFDARLERYGPQDIADYMD